MQERHNSIANALELRLSCTILSNWYVFITSRWRHQSAMAFQITSLTIVCSVVYSGADQWKHQSSASLAFVWGIHRWPVNSPHKWPVPWKMFPFDDVIMKYEQPVLLHDLLMPTWFLLFNTLAPEHNGSCFWTRQNKITIFSSKDCFLAYDWQRISIGSLNGLVSNQRLVIS